MVPGPSRSDVRACQRPQRLSSTASRVLTPRLMWWPICRASWRLPAKTTKRSASAGKRSRWPRSWDSRRFGRHALNNIGIGRLAAGDHEVSTTSSKVLPSPSPSTRRERARVRQPRLDAGVPRRPRAGVCHARGGDVVWRALRPRRGPPLVEGRSGADRSIFEATGTLRPAEYDELIAEFEEDSYWMEPPCRMAARPHAPGSW